MAAFDIKRAAALDAREQQSRWLVDELWAEQAVGIVGGEPKCCKSFLALDLAVAVASGAPALRRFAVQRTGTVLLFAAEDALHVVRARLQGICQIAGVCFDDLDVQVITASSVRLDLETDRARLAETVASVRPVLLVLDPFVRLHRVDENAAADVAPLLAYLHASCSAASRPPCCWSTTRKRARPTSALARPCAGRPNCMPGATPTSTSGAAANSFCCRSSIVPRRRSPRSPSS
jgi:hypothetical protein